MIKRPLSVFLLLSLSLVPAFAQSGMVDIPDIIGRRAAGVIPVVVSADNNEALLLAQKCFKLHGGFEVVGSGGQHTVQLSASGPRGMRLVLLDRQGRETFQQVVAGADWFEATTRACDLAVERLLGVPGFFSGRVAFAGQRGGAREIYLGDITFMRVRPMTSHGKDSLTPHLSPDGRRILYTSYYRTGFPDLFMIDMDTGTIRPFASFKGTNTGGAFHPSGRRVAVILSSPGNPELYLMDAQGTNPVRLTRNTAIESSPTWSPDGSQLVVASDMMGSSPQLYRIPATGGALERLPTNISRYCAEPAWNPRAANLLAFTANVGGGFQIALYDFRTTQTQVLAVGGGDNVEPAWLNDGRHLIFTKRQGGAEQLHLHDIVTGTTRALHTTALGRFSQASFAYPR